MQPFKKVLFLRQSFYSFKAKSILVIDNLKMEKKMKIALEGMKFYAYHGFYEEEAILGNEFVIDVIIETDFSKASKSDDLNQTVNYEHIYSTCSSVMTQRAKLLETVGERIIELLKSQHPEIQTITVRIRKLNPPFGGDVTCAFIELTHNYSI